MTAHELLTLLYRVLGAYVGLMALVVAAIVLPSWWRGRAVHEPPPAGGTTRGDAGSVAGTAAGGES